MHKSPIFQQATPRVIKFGKLNQNFTEIFFFRSTPGQVLISEAFLRKSEENRPPKIDHFRGGLLSSLLANNPSIRKIFHPCDHKSAF